MEVKDLLKKVVAAVEDKKANHVVALEIGKVSIITDYFVICSANSKVQVQAIGDHVKKVLGEEGIHPRSVEGLREGTWALLDFGNVVLHIFQEDERRYYNLEKLWGDAKLIDFSQNN